MEPSGIMDNKSLHNIDSNDPNHHQHNRFGTGGLIMCDLGDEEVHFSRDSTDYYYCYGPSTSNRSVTDPTHNNYATLSLDSNLADINLANYPSNSAAAHHHGTSADLGAYAEQTKSNRLLNSIGSKLRRGSNYLIAPKLVGQYLLGITVQSWSEFFNTSRMMKAPSNTHQLTRRLLSNLSYFQGNYLCVSLVLVIYCILTLPLLLLAIAAYLVALYLVTARSALGKQVRIFGYRLNLQQQYSFITMLSLPLLWVAGAPSAVFWVIGASFFIVGLHASMYSNERSFNDLSIDHNNQHQQGNYISNQSHKRSSVQYYNHYRNSTPNTYLPLQGTTSPKSPTTTSSSSTSTKDNCPSITGGYVSNTISQWIPFSGNSNRLISERSPPDAFSSAGQQRVPEVKIISQDYAGLGRVYEV